MSTNREILDEIAIDLRRYSSYIVDIAEEEESHEGEAKRLRHWAYELEQVARALLV